MFIFQAYITLAGTVTQQQTTAMKSNKKIDAIELVKATQACGDSLSRFSQHLQSKNGWGAIETAWVISFFLEQLPQTVDNNPSLDEALKLLQADVNRILNGKKAHGRN